MVFLDTPINAPNVTLAGVSRLMLKIEAQVDLHECVKKLW